MTQLIAANYLSTLEKCLEPYGVVDFLKIVGFDASKTNDPAAYISYTEFSSIVAKAYELTGCEHLGLVFGQSLSIATHGYLGYAAMSSPVLGHAIEMMIRFLNTRTGIFEFTLNQAVDKSFNIEIHRRISDDGLSVFIIEMIVAHFLKMRQFLIHTENSILKIEVDYAAPQYVDEYKKLLNTDVIFNSNHCRVWFDKSEYDCPVNFADDASYKLARVQLQTLADDLASSDDLPSKIKTILMNSDMMDMSMEDIASTLCMTSRTLRRHLQPYSISYQELVDDVRHQKAMAYLLNPKISLTEISYLLGFHDTSSFTKAFKRWSGMTPSDYRELSR